MHAFGIVGPDAAEATDLVVESLEGRTAVVRNRSASDARHRATASDRGDREPRRAPEASDGGAQRARPATEYDLGAEWRAYGEELGLDDALDRLTPGHDHAVAVGFGDARLPQVALGDVSVRDPLVTASSARELDVDAVVDAVAGIEPRETLESLVARVERSPDADRSGAIATFTGRVRARDGSDDDRTEFLQFEKYEGVAERRMREIEADLEDRDGVFEVATYHRTGVLAGGEDIVHVVVLAGHRREAFRAVEDGIDRLKADVPIFKKEVTESETFWVHERE